MFNRVLVVSVGLLAAACGSPSQCISGDSKSCACTDGRTGAQTCSSDGAYGACDCTGGNTTACSQSCAGCCDATGTCLPGNTVAACGVQGDSCTSCSGSRSCTGGACVETCLTGFCRSNGQCVQSLENYVANNCGTDVCAVCTTNQHCVSNTCTSFKRVFATRTTYTADFGGLSGGDAKCALAATSAGLPGTFTAWISSGSVDALSRISSDGPWFAEHKDFNGFAMVTTTRRLFNNKANLQTLPLANDGAWVNELGEGFVGNIWTGTDTGGTRNAATCTSWTSLSNVGAVGYIGGSGGPDDWTAAGAQSCGNTASLLCFEN